MPLARYTSLGLTHTTMASPGQYGPPPSALERFPNTPNMNPDHLNNTDGSRVLSQLPSVADLGGAHTMGSFPPTPATVASGGAATFVGCKPSRKVPDARPRSPRLVPMQRVSTNLGSIIRRAESGHPKVHGAWCQTKHAVGRVGRNLKRIFHFGTQVKGFVVHNVTSTAVKAVRSLSPILRSNMRSFMRSRRGQTTRMTSPIRATQPGIRTSDMSDSQPTVVETTPDGTRTSVYQPGDVNLACLTAGKRATMFQGQRIVTAADTDAGTALDVLEGRTPQTTAGADNERTSTGLSFDRDEPETLSTPRHSKQSKTRADSATVISSTETSESTRGTRRPDGFLPTHIVPTQTFEALFEFLQTLPLEQLNNKELVQGLANAPLYKKDAGCQWLCAKIVADIDDVSRSSSESKSANLSSPTRPDTKHANTLPPDILPFIASIPPMSPFPETSAWDRSSVAGSGTLFKVRKQLAAETADQMNAVPSPIPASLRPGSQMFPKPAPRPAVHQAAAGALPYPATTAAAQPVPRSRPNPAPRPHTYAEPSSGLGYIAYGGSFEPYGPATPVKGGAAQTSRRSSTDSLGAFLKKAARAEHRNTVNKIESVMLTPVVAQMPRPANPQPASNYSVAMPTPSAFGGGYFRDSSPASAGAPAPPPVPAPIAPSSQQPHRQRHTKPRKPVPSSSRPQQAQPVGAPSRDTSRDNPLPPPPPAGNPNRFTLQATHPLRMNQAHVFVERQPRHRREHRREQIQQHRGEAQRRQQAADEAPRARPSKMAKVRNAFRGLLEVNHEFGQRKR
ncbi:hypothetical protein EJ03DRAFT_116810 [Teratosphaeria nubilosa]|uniref:Uncharacterized protein n=1 Tax=Teratosphaeria nubilosa TaxID=161662 RepID=A0A6G1L758_9PEZI|nr:hypothetical protein EJ03DRAFT_116810 [Teratosphaeria nubilosa]